MKKMKIGFFCIAWLIGVVYLILYLFKSVSNLVGVYSFLDLPEKNLISACIAGGVALFSSLRLNDIKVFWFISFWIALIISLISISKVVLFFYAADSDISGWHHICVWIGLALIVGAVSSIEEMNQ